jgi:FdhE protein
MAEPDLREAWVDLLHRRPTFAPSLTVYGEIIESWARWSPPRPLGLTLRREACRDSWERGIPLTADAAGALQIGDVEELVGGAMEALVRAQPSLAPGFQRFAEAWDAGWLGPQTLLPDVGRVGSDALEKATGLSRDVVAVVATVGLRPALEALFAPVREHLTEGGWDLGICPFCGGPPGFTDVIEDGRRRMACHLCGGAWVFTKLRCPFCGIEGSQHVVRILPVDAQEEGYVISACRSCRAYVKEVDRRARWNAGPALVEDWGTPHFDVIALGQGYWRPVPALVQWARSP